MTGSWHTILADWRKYRRQGQIQETSEPPVDIELNAASRNVKRIDSGASFGSITLINEDHADPEWGIESHPEEPIHLELDFGDGVHIKPLDYETFSCRGAIEGLMLTLEKDGIIINELWDSVEKMRVCGGDWDARVRPGWVLQVYSQDVQSSLERDQPEDDSDSEDTEGEEEHWIDDVLDQYQDEWCLPRWRDRVEQEKSISGIMREPSWVVLGMGCLSVMFFIAAVIVYST